MLYKSIGLPTRLSTISEVSIREAFVEEIKIRQEFFEQLSHGTGSQIILNSPVLSAIFCEAIRNTLSIPLREIATEDDESYVIVPLLHVIYDVINRWPEHSYTVKYLESAAFLEILDRVLYSPLHKEQDLVSLIIALILEKIQYQNDFGEYLAVLRNRIGRMLRTTVFGNDPTLTRSSAKALLIYANLVGYEAEDHGFFQDYLLSFIDSPSLPTVLAEFKTIFVQRLSLLRSRQDFNYDVNAFAYIHV